MNIFVLDKDTKLAAQYHNDKHVVKMVTESAQILSSVLHLSGKGYLAPYKLTHKNHPCVLWALESKSNWRWLRELGMELGSEYYYRYGWKRMRRHKAEGVIYYMASPSIPDIGLTDFALAMPDQYKTNDPVESYRNYYNGEKLDISKYTKRQRPYWLK